MPWAAFVGKHAAATTDGRMGAEILTYCRSRGLFAGVSLDGAVIRPDADANVAFARDSRPTARGLSAELKARLGRAGLPHVKGREQLPTPVAEHPPQVLGERAASRVEWASAVPFPPDKVEVAISGLVAAAVELAYRSARRSVARRWSVA